jgi:hypothetical protein
MIIFPATGVFANLGAMGVSMFFVSYVSFDLYYLSHLPTLAATGRSFHNWRILLVGVALQVRTEA